MGRRIFGAAFLVAAAAFLACDLFHSTDFPTLCDVQPSAPACHDGEVPDEGVPPSPTNFCQWQPAQANDHAQKACAWLGACESPQGHNRFGACMIAALLAYDCNANPDRPVTGALHDYWDALWQARTCADIDRAVFPAAGAGDKVPLCENGGGFASCGVKYAGGDNRTVRVACYRAGAAAVGENCIAEGQTCVNGQCVASARFPCTISGCQGTELSACDDAGVDRGTDCAFFGASACVTTDAGPACKTSGNQCTPTTMVACDDAGVATGCPSGTSETIHCTSLTGLHTCNPGPASPPWDVSSACSASDAGACGDSCDDAGAILGCARGRPFTTSCSGWELGSCVMVDTVDGPRSACGKPLPQ